MGLVDFRFSFLVYVQLQGILVVLQMRSTLDDIDEDPDDGSPFVLATVYEKHISGKQHVFACLDSGANVDSNPTGDCVLNLKSYDCAISTSGGSTSSVLRGTFPFRVLERHGKGPCRSRHRVSVCEQKWDTYL